LNDIGRKGTSYNKKKERKKERKERKEKRKKKKRNSLFLFSKFFLKTTKQRDTFFYFPTNNIDHKARSKGQPNRKWKV